MAHICKNAILIKFVRNLVRPGSNQHVRKISGPAFDSGPSFKYDDLEINLTDNPREKPPTDTLVFGRHTSDHMLKVEWTMNRGWGKPVICPVENLSIHPAAKVLHYAQELFEGLKAYRGCDDKVRLFRPVENMDRMYKTAERVCLPTFDRIELLKCMKRLVQVEESWVPCAAEFANALYLRPTMIGTEPCLGVNISNSALLYVLTGPVGPFYSTGVKPVSLMADPDHTRAWYGGCGQFKTGSNYGPTVAVQIEAARRGCQQVLWLFGPDHQLTEVGTMNLFMHWYNKDGQEELVTAPLEGLILPGVTRKSLIQIANEWGEFRVVERTYTMEDLIIGLLENRVIELFGAGTACVVCPVERILYRDEWLNIPLAKDEKSLTNRFLKELMDIHYAKKSHPWMELVDDLENSGCSYVDGASTDSESELEDKA